MLYRGFFISQRTLSKKARRLSITLYDHRGSEGRKLDTFISAHIGIPRPANNLEEEATARNKLTYSNSPNIGDLGCDQVFDSQTPGSQQTTASSSAQCISAVAAAANSVCLPADRCAVSSMFMALASTCIEMITMSEEAHRPAQREYISVPTTIYLLTR